MHLPRKSSFTVMLVAALFGAPALASVQAPGAYGDGDHPPVIHLATLPSRTPLRRRVRGAKARLIGWRAGRWVRGAAARIRAGRETVQPRLPPHESFARGPPRPSSR
jgi:hypothetical protein